MFAVVFDAGKRSPALQVPGPGTYPVDKPPGSDACSFSLRSRTINPHDTTLHQGKGSLGPAAPYPGANVSVRSHSRQLLLLPSLVQGPRRLSKEI